MSICYAAVTVELREVLLREKPVSLAAASPKATVPVLQLPDGRVVDESAAIMRWALDQSDPERWRRDELALETDALVEENDTCFKVHLDHYKYWDRFPGQTQTNYRSEGEKFLCQLEYRLVSCIKLTVDMRAFDAHAPLLSKSPQHFLSIRTVFYLRYVFR